MDMQIASGMVPVNRPLQICRFPYGGLGYGVCPGMKFRRGELRPFVGECDNHFPALVVGGGCSLVRPLKITIRLPIHRLTFGEYGFLLLLVGDVVSPTANVAQLRHSGK